MQDIISKLLVRAGVVKRRYARTHTHTLGIAWLQRTNLFGLFQFCLAVIIGEAFYFFFLFCTGLEQQRIRSELKDAIGGINSY